MINVQGIRRNMKNVVKNYTEAQVKVREATSNDPWGPSSTLMSEIADLTYNVVAFSEIMQMIWKRLNDHGKNWRHVYKALVLLEYLIKTGSEKVAQQCRENIFAIQTLKDFQYIEENKDQGMNVREKSKLLVGLLKDEEKLKVERSRALKAKERFAQSMSYMGTSVTGDDGAVGSLPRTSTSYHESLSSSGDHYAFGGASSRLSSDLETARPQTLGEEELQLQLALAMSKEEAEQEEKIRKNDDIRLKMAINESEGSASKKVPVNHHKPPSSSAMDDLLSLNVGNTVSAPTDPWGVPFNNGNDINVRKDAFGVLTGPPQTNNIGKPKDPWASQPTSNSSLSGGGGGATSSNDPWSNPVQSKANNDPWQASPTTTPVNCDPWSPINSDANNRMNMSLSPSMDFCSSGNLSPSNMSGAHSSIRKTPENFLGANSNLVNLDALVSVKPPPVVASVMAPIAGNPFAPASSASALSNPFQSAKPPAPTINQLRAQNQFSAPFEPNSTNNNPNANPPALQPTLFNSAPLNSSSPTQNPFSM